MTIETWHAGREYDVARHAVQRIIVKYDLMLFLLEDRVSRSLSCGAAPHPVGS